MGTHEKKEWLQWQLAETQSLLDSIQGSQLMRLSLQSRIEDIQQQIDQLPADEEDAKIRMLFAGKAVLGSKGIKSYFAGKMMKSVQELIKLQTIVDRYGDQVGKRGRTKNSRMAQMYLTNLSHGSFGFELSLMKDIDLFERNEVAHSIKEVIDIINIASTDQDRYEQLFNSYPQRMFSYLKEFFKLLVDEESVAKLESGTNFIELSKADTQNGFNRINSTICQENIINISGIFKGAFVDTGKFEFQDADGNIKHGRISEDITEEQIVQYNQTYSNESCIMVILEQNFVFGSGNRRIGYELIQIQ